MTAHLSFLNRLKKNPIVRGTVILTIGSTITRIIGFFFRIFLSHTIGAEGIGIYQLIFPVQLICYALCTSGFELAISRLVAMNQRKQDVGMRILKCGLILSLSISLVIAFLVYNNYAWIANRILFESRCEKLIMWMSLSIPLASIHSCICGYYLGQKKASVPAWSQLIEQCIRILSIMIIVQVLTEQNIPVTPEIAVIGSFIGEIFSVLFTLFSISGAERMSARIGAGKVFYFVKPIVNLAMPITLNRLMLSVMQSIQSILIPFCLMESGLSSSEALSLYGICLGLVIPLILFPSSFIHSICLMLLPTIAEAQEEQTANLHRTSFYSTKFSAVFGVYCSIMFVTFGNEFGMLLFHNVQSGKYIQILGLLCPFLYITSTLASILNGLGKTSTTFAFSVVSTLIQLGCTILLIPQIEILGYLLGMLFSSVVNTVLHFFVTEKYLGKKLHICSGMLVPVMVAIAMGLMVYYCNFKFLGASVIIRILVLGLEGIVMTGVFLYAVYRVNK